MGDIEYYIYKFDFYKILICKIIKCLIYFQTLWRAPPRPKKNTSPLAKEEIEEKVLKSVPLPINHLLHDKVSRNDNQGGDQVGFHKPIFGRNNDAKRLSKFGKKDGFDQDAIDELDDNSYSYGGTEVTNDYNERERVLIHTDNGHGMNEEELQRMSDFDSHNTDTSTIGQHGIGHPRAVTKLCYPIFDEDEIKINGNFKVTRTSLLKIETAKKADKLAKQLVVAYMGVNKNGNYQDCFTYKKVERTERHSYTKITISAVSEKIHGDLVNMNKPKEITDIFKNKDIKSKTTYKNGGCMPNHFELSDQYLSSKFKLELHKINIAGVTYYPVRIVQCEGDGVPLGWINRTPTRYSSTLQDEPKKKYEDLHTSIIVDLGVNKSRYSINEKKEGNPCAFNPQINPDERQMEFLKPYSIMDKSFDSMTGKEKAGFTTQYDSVLSKDFSVILDTATIKRRLGSYRFNPNKTKVKGFKGSDNTLKQEYNAIKKIISINKDADVKDFSKEIKSDIDGKLLPPSVDIALYVCVSQFKRIIGDKIKNPMKKKYTEKQMLDQVAVGGEEPSSQSTPRVESIDQDTSVGEKSGDHVATEDEEPSSQSTPRVESIDQDTSVGEKSGDHVATEDEEPSSQSTPRVESIDQDTSVGEKSGDHVATEDEEPFSQSTARVESTDQDTTDKGESGDEVDVRDEEPSGQSTARVESIGQDTAVGGESGDEVDVNGGGAATRLVLGESDQVATDTKTPINISKTEVSAHTRYTHRDIPMDEVIKCFAKMNALGWDKPISSNKTIAEVFNDFDKFISVSGK